MANTQLFQSLKSNLPWSDQISSSSSKVFRRMQVGLHRSGRGGRGFESRQRQIRAAVAQW